MILVDTSVWADHFRQGDTLLARQLEQQLVAVHPFVLGELALGHLKPRAAILGHLAALPRAPAAREGQVLDLIEAKDLMGTGIGYVDAHLLAAARLDGHMRLWTRDRRLRIAAERLGIAFPEM